MTLTLDGAQLTKKLSFFMMGLKIVDLDVQKPLPGLFELDPKAEGVKYLPQSQKWNLLLKICMGKESKAMYQEEFSSLFNIFLMPVKRGIRYSLTGKASILVTLPIWQLYKRCLVLVKQLRSVSFPVIAAQLSQKYCCTKGGQRN